MTTKPREMGPATTGVPAGRVPSEPHVDSRHRVLQLPPSFRNFLLLSSRSGQRAFVQTEILSRQVRTGVVGDDRAYFRLS